MTFVGSGGSYAVAAFVAALHEMYAERLARPATPLDVACTPATRNSGILFISARGKHPDVLGAFRAVAEMEPPALGAFCGTESGPLADLVRTVARAVYLPVQFPEKDGFLATKSVLASAVLLMKAYWAAYSVNHSLPPYTALDPPGTERMIQSAKENTAILWTYPQLLVLHGPAGAAAALDIESRFQEAGVAAVQLADFRNFAHGRYYWLARKGDSTAVLALVSPTDRRIASRTLDLLPSDVKWGKVEVNASDPLASVELLLLSIHMGRWAALANGFDPRKPKVPKWGRKIYHLDIWPLSLEEARRQR